MKLLVLKGSGIVIEKSNTMTIVENGIDVGHMIYANADLFIIEEGIDIPEDFCSGKYVLENGVLRPNAGYSEPVNPEVSINDLRSIEAENALLRQQMAEQNQAFSDFMELVFTKIPNLQ